MIDKQNKYYKLTAVLFGIYLILLIWALLFKLEFSVSPYFRSLNFIPYGEPAVANDKTNFKEIALNIIAFMPYGLFISILKPSLKFFCKLLPIIITTILIELFQYIFQIGATDITDIINNTLGGICGIELYNLLYRFWGDKIDKAIIIILFICILLFSALIAVIKIINA